MACRLELQREKITRIELALGPYFFLKSICLVDMNMFARFDEIPTMTLEDIKETKLYGWMDGRMHGHENSIHPTNSLRGYNNNKTKRP